MNSMMIQRELQQELSNSAIGYCVLATMAYVKQ